MKKQTIILSIVCIICAFILSKCSENKPAENSSSTAPAVSSNGGFESQIKWGEHLVLVSGCNDCHTPKKMSPMGPVNDDSLMLSGHPSQLPVPAVDRKMVQGQGLAVTNDLTVWVGAWGISYAANITPDSTGIGAWTEEQFIRCLREGKWMGVADSRTLLPPMPWQDFKNYTDDEIKAVFAYLKSIKPIHNIVPNAEPPVKM